jgi:hypothetical protein
MVFGSVWIDIIVVAICGVVGGFGLGLLQERGIELPHGRGTIDKSDKDKDRRVNFYDFGFLSEMLVGALAAIILYALNQPKAELQMIASGITSGLGGAGVLRGFIEKNKNQELGQVATEAVNQALLFMPTSKKRRIASGAKSKAAQNSALDYPSFSHQLLTKNLGALQSRIKTLTKG